MERAALICRRGVVAVLLCCWPAGIVEAAARDDVLRLVPDDAGFCLVVQNLREQSNAFLQSPFAAEWCVSPLGQALPQSLPVQKLQAVAELMRQHLQISWPQLRDEILGDIVVLAFYPSATGKAQEDQDLLILHARDPGLLAALLERLNALQKQSGDLKELQTRTYRGIDYIYRQERSKEQFYCVRGSRLVFSSKEAMLQKVLARELEQSSAEAMLPQQLRRAGVESTLATLWVNPRAFDGQLQQKSRESREPEALLLKRVLDYWKALDGIALSLAVHRSDFEAALTLLAREGELPPAARLLFAPDSEPSELWRRFPTHALLTVAGRLDAPAATRLVGEFVPEEARRTVHQTVNQSAGAVLGLDVCQDLLPNLGPDWGICIVAPAEDDPAPLPLALAALRVHAGPRDQPVDRLLVNGLHTLAALLVLSHNQGHREQLTLKTIVQDKVEITYLKGERVWPTGLSPAFALKDGYLLIASSPEAIRQFAAARPAGSVSAAQTPVLRMALQAIGRYLERRLDALAVQLAAMHNLPQSAAQERLLGLALSCKLLDQLEVTRRADPGRMVLAVRLATAKPLSPTR